MGVPTCCLNGACCAAVGLYCLCAGGVGGELPGEHSHTRPCQGPYSRYSEPDQPFQAVRPQEIGAVDVQA
eukprot:23865-Eustigmatos_ZCMA.PRE.1